MDAVIKPNVSFPFTVINASQFKSINTGQIFKSRIYNIPDYWFKDETALIEFSKTLKDSCDFIDYFFENLKYAVKNKFESTIILTLRTNTNIIFVKTDSEGYNNTIDKLIELNVVLERYEQCQKLLEFKTSIDENFYPIRGKSLYYEAYEFWNPIYPQNL
jgi:hypothetical protein